MKLLRLTFDRFATDIKRNPLTMLLFAIGTILAVTMIIYIWGNFMPSKIVMGTQSLAYRQIQVNFTERQAINVDDLKILDDFGISEVIISVIYEQLSSSDPQVVYSACRDNNESKDLFPTLFEESQLLGDNIIIPIEDSREGSIEVLGHSFMVVKKSAEVSSNTYYIPIHSIISNKVKIDRLTFVLKTVPDNNTISKIRGILKSAFDRPVINDATNYTSTDNAKSITIIFMIFVSSIVAMISYMFLFNYIVENDKNTYVTYIITGGSNAKIILSLMIEIFSLSLISSSLAIFIHKTFYLTLFDKINMYPNITYNGLDYIIIMLICVVLSTVTALPYMIKIIRSSIVSLKKEIIG